MTLDSVRDFILREFLPGEDPAAVSPELPLVSSGIIDSVGVLKLVLFLEESFQIEVDSRDIAAGRLDSLSAIAQLLEEKTGA